MTLHPRLPVPAIALTLLLCAPAPGGDLGPPSGPVAETMLPLDAVEPRTPLDPADVPIEINAPGSYVLTGNILASGPGQIAITINAADVTLDLRGFVIGQSGIGAFDQGIEIAETVSNVTIVNGTIRDSVFDAINGFNAEDCTFADLRLVANGQYGISTTAESTVLRCAAVGNGSGGILINGSTAIIDSCRAELNGQTGISVGPDSSVTRCVSLSNGQGGNGTGFILSAGSTCTGCTASGNDSFGFFSAGGDVALRGCTADSNGADGIVLGSGGLVESCTSASNTFDGIDATASIVRNCLVRSNGRRGISVGSDSLITGNQADSNTQAGIYVFGNDNRIDANSATNNALGIDVDGSSNLVVRNSASANTTSQFDVVEDNDLGTVQTSPVGAGAWDNLSY